MSKVIDWAVLAFIAVAAVLLFTGCLSEFYITTGVCICLLAVADMMDDRVFYRRKRVSIITRRVNRLNSLT